MKKIRMDQKGITCFWFLSNKLNFLEDHEVGHSAWYLAYVVGVVANSIGPSLWWQGS
jgi:hypothetical protein